MCDMKIKLFSFEMRETLDRPQLASPSNMRNESFPHYFAFGRKRRTKRSRGVYAKKCNRGFPAPCVSSFETTTVEWKNQRRALSPLVVPSTRYLPTDLINVTRNIELCIFAFKIPSRCRWCTYSHFKAYNHTRGRLCDCQQFDFSF